MRKCSEHSARNKFSATSLKRSVTPLSVRSITGFREEREWRVIYSPAYAKSDVLIPDIQSIRGVPQQIYKIPLKDIPDQSLVGIELHSLIDRVIVGPTQYPQATYGALVSLLEKAGMTDARKRVVVSDIPLRQFD
jgi:hypothetical protein